MTATKNLEGVVLDMRQNFGFIWCKDLGEVFVASSRNPHLPSRVLDSVFRPGNWVQFRAIRQVTKNACSWLAVNVLLQDNPPSLKSQNNHSTHKYEMRLEGYGVAFPNINNRQAGFIWNDELGIVRFARFAVTIQPPSIPAPFTVVHFIAKFSSDDGTSNYFEATEVGPGTPEERRLLADSSSIMKFEKSRVRRLPSSSAPGVFYCGEADEELLCVPGAELFSRISSVRQLDPDCSYLIHAVPNVWDPADVSVDQYVTESHRKKKWRVLAVEKEAPEPVAEKEAPEPVAQKAAPEPVAQKAAPEPAETVEAELEEELEQLGLEEPASAPTSALAIFGIVVKDRILFDKMEALYPGFMTEFMRQKELKRQSDMQT